MSEPDIKSKKSEFFRDCMDFIFGFENKRGEILNHWIAFSDSFIVQPTEFYETLEQEMAARKFPNVEFSREEFAEGGVLSDKRIYLRFFRERLALDMCAAPFGTGYFFSSRMVYVPALLRLWHILAIGLVLGVVWNPFVQLLGVTYAVIALVTLLFAVAATLRNVATGSYADLDSVLLAMPVISTIYEQFFRDETYYRTDTRLVYLQRLSSLIIELAEESAAKNGVKLVEQFQTSPILGDLYKRLKPESKPESA